MSTSYCKMCFELFNGTQCPACGSRHVDMDEDYPPPSVTPLTSVIKQLEEILDTIVKINAELRRVDLESFK